MRILVGSIDLAPRDGFGNHHCCDENLSGPEAILGLSATGCRRARLILRQGRGDCEVGGDEWVVE